MRIGARARVMTLAIALAVATVACTTNRQEPAEPTMGGGMTGTPGAPPATSVDLASGGPALQQALTALLQEHEYLAGIAVSQGVANGLDSPQFQAAAEALGANSQALADAVASVYGDEAGKAFLPLCEKHIGFFVNYTKGLATGDDALARRSVKQLDAYRTDFGAFIESATEGRLTTEQVADALRPHVESTLAAIDAVVTGEGGNPFELLREAAGHMPMIATALAGAIADQFPERYTA